MRQALRQAELAYQKNEVPVGAVIVCNNQIISRGFNQVEMLQDCTAHAEMIALTAAFNALGSKYITEATIYITLEPCLMCCGAMYLAKPAKIVYGAEDIKNGYRKITGNVSPFHNKTEIVTGLLAKECAKLITDFFKERR